MALSGVHIAYGSMLPDQVGQITLLYTCTASQSMTSPGTAGIFAPGDVGFQCVLSISASAAIFYAVGHQPNASTGPRRYYDPSFGREDIFVDPETQFAWVFA